MLLRRHPAPLRWLPARLRRTVAFLLCSALLCGSGAVAQPLRMIAVGQALIDHPLSTSSEVVVAKFKAAQGYLGSSGADVVFTNFEGCLAVEGHRAGKEAAHGADPLVLDDLKAMGFNLLSLANNHAYDFGAPGVMHTLEEVKKRGITCAGSGEDSGAATQPGILTTGQKVRVALIAMASGGFGADEEKREIIPREHVNILDLQKNGELVASDAERILGEITRLKKSGKADYIIVYHHNHFVGAGRQTLAGKGGMELPKQAPAWMQAWAKRCVDAGANAYLAHGVPRLFAVEVYRGSPLFYGLGGFIFHTQRPKGHWEPNAWRSVVADIRFGEDRRVTQILLRPLVLNEDGERDAGQLPGSKAALALYNETRGAPALAVGREAAEILQEVVELSEKVPGNELRVEKGADEVSEFARLVVP